MKLDEKAISEILVADTDSESGAEVSDVQEEEGGGQGGEEGEQQKLLVRQASAQDKPTAPIGRGIPPWGPRQGRNTNVHPFVGPAKGVKKSEVPQTFCSDQNYVSNKLFTLHSTYCMRFEGLNLL